MGNSHGPLAQRLTDVANGEAVRDGVPLTVVRKPAEWSSPHHNAPMKGRST